MWHADSREPGTSRVQYEDQDLLDFLSQAPPPPTLYHSPSQRIEHTDPGFNQYPLDFLPQEPSTPTLYHSPSQRIEHIDPSFNQYPPGFLPQEPSTPTLYQSPTQRTGHIGPGFSPEYYPGMFPILPPLQYPGSDQEDHFTSPASQIWSNNPGLNYLPSPMQRPDYSQGDHITSQPPPSFFLASSRIDFPQDIFLNPADPVRRELCHKIQQEDWFVNQIEERPITSDEASRIPGSLLNKSVLLAFYDRVPGTQNNRTMMRCTICEQKNQGPRLYSRPDRANIHMRHHFGLRPFPCHGLCNASHCGLRFYTAGDLNAHVAATKRNAAAAKKNATAVCKYCKKSFRPQNLRRHIESCGMDREYRVQGQDLDAPQMSTERRASASLTVPRQQGLTPDISLGGRIIRLVMYGRVSSEDVHRAWVHRQTKISNVTEELLAVYQIGATESFVILEADWGPQPCWNEADPDSSIGEACQVLYVIFKRQFMRYILGVVRDSLTDFPVCISILVNTSPKTISECITASHPELVGRIKSITGYASDEDISNHQLDSARIDTISFSNLRTAIIITLVKPPDKFTASPSSDIDNLWALITHQTELSYMPIPALLQVPFLYCEHLMQRAYTLDIFALQMIHITGATRHLVISLANDVKTVFADEPSGVDAVLAAEGDLADLLQVAPLLSHELKNILDRIGRVIERLEEDSFNGEEPRGEIDAIFASLCGDFPGAVTVRHSYTLFKRLVSIDHQEIQALDRHTTNPEMIQLNVSNENGDASGPHYGQDADDEMLDSESVGRSLAGRQGMTHIGENDEDMVVDLDGSERSQSGA